MSACCGEASCRRSTPIQIGHGFMSGRWYVVTRWRRRRGSDVVEAIEKHDVTEQLTAVLIAEGWTPPATVPEEVHDLSGSS